MPETSGSGSPPTRTEAIGALRRLRQPAPRFGELAPPGWDWKPPVGHEPVPVPSHPPIRPAAGPVTNAVAPGGRKPAPAWDVRLTIAMLLVGVLGVFTFVQVQNSLPQAIAELHAQEGIGSYTPAASVPAIIMGGLIAQVALWFIAAALSTALLLRRRRAFWVPLVVGVIATLTMFGVILAVLAGDPTLLNHLQTARL